VAVIGGGLAGVAAALAAADGGADVVLIERRGRLGGLTWSFRRDGRWFDNGQHVFLRCCTAYRSFLDRIDASDQVVLQDRLEIPVLAPGGARSTISRSGLPAPFHLTGSLLRYRHLRAGQRAALVGPVLALTRLDPDDPSLDTRTFGEFLADHGQSAAAIERLWNLIVLPTVNVRSAEASLALAVTVFRTGLLDRADSADIGWSAVPLRQLHGDHSARALESAGVEVRVGVQVDRLVRHGDRWRFSWTAPGTGSEEVDAVIVATPPEVAEALVPAGTIAPVAGLGTSPIVNVHLVLDRKVTDLPMAACIDSPIQYVFDRTASSGTPSSGSASSGSGASQCLSISLSAADRYLGMRPEALVQTFRAALDEVMPAARGAALVDATVSRERAATFRGVPGTAHLRPGAATVHPGLALAGAWCDTGWPATMEGAVRSGTAAAEVVLSGTTERSGATESGATELSGMRELAGGSVR
jgi:squalene-associated FAD-dependent desaturase